LASKQYELIPITHDKFHLAAFNRKLTKSTDTKEYNIYSDYHQDVQGDQAASRVINLTLPSMENVDLSELIRFRNEKRESLKKFRDEMAKLAQDIQYRYYDEQFNASIRRIVDDKIIDSLSDIRESMKLWHRVSKIGKPILEYAVPMIVNILIGKPVDPASGSGNAAAAGIEAIQEDRQRMKNGLAYLIEIERKFNLLKGKPKKRRR
jgi:hypothetical protein